MNFSPRGNITKFYITGCRPTFELPAERSGWRRAALAASDRSFQTLAAAAAGHTNWPSDGQCVTGTTRVLESAEWMPRRSFSSPSSCSHWRDKSIFLIPHRTYVSLRHFAEITSSSNYFEKSIVSIIAFISGHKGAHKSRTHTLTHRQLQNSKIVSKNHYTTKLN